MIHQVALLFAVLAVVHAQQQFPGGTPVLVGPAPVQQPVQQPGLVQTGGRSSICVTLNGVYQDTTDCSRYYKCDGGSPTIQNCANGLLFNAKTNQCDWPMNVQCMNRRAQANIKPELATLCNTRPSGKPTAQTFLKRHPRICNMYFTCTLNYLFPGMMACPQNEYFNEVNGECRPLGVTETQANTVCGTTKYVSYNMQDVEKLSDDGYIYVYPQNPYKPLYEKLMRLRGQVASPAV